jgi:D-3-phosphoglycerate dehydrogenase
MAKILITPRSLTDGGNPALEPLKAAGHKLIYCRPGEMPTEEDLLRLLPGCAGYLAGVEKVSARLIESDPELKVIARNGVGIDNVDLEAARLRGVQVRGAPGANSRGVAELTIGLILSLARSIPRSDSGLKAGGWKRFKGFELAGRTLGLIGCGNVGRTVAELAAGLGMQVVGYDVVSAPSFAPPGFRWVSLEELYRQAELVSLHCPSQGRVLLDREAIGRMRRGVYLLNTARADLVDEAALLEALESGQVAGYATDVFSEEPPRDLRLVRHERVIATPHIGGLTDESVSRAVKAAVRAILDVLGR